MKPDNADALIDSDELAAFLRISRHTLDQWVHFGTGPPYYKVGRHRRYRREDIDEWLREHRSQ